MIVVIGASKGLGKSIFEHLLRKKKRVIGLARNTATIKNESINCDVRNYDSILNAVSHIKKLKEPIDAVINVAGIASMNMAVTTDKLTVENLIQTNLIGTIYSCQLFSPLMIREKQGSFINFSTIAVPLAIKGESIYVASKAGVEAFSRTFAREMACFNIRVNCIAPGPIKTDLLSGVSEKQINNIVSRQIIPKIFEKKDICNLIDLLLDKKSSALSGETFHVGGV